MTERFPSFLTADEVAALDAAGCERASICGGHWSSGAIDSYFRLSGVDIFCDNHSHISEPFMLRIRPHRTSRQISARGLDMTARDAAAIAAVRSIILRLLNDESWRSSDEAQG